MKTRVVMAALIGASLVATAVTDAHAASRVRYVGSYVNDATWCAGELGATTTTVSCRGGSVWHGGLTGKTYIERLTGSMSTGTRDVRARYHEWFFGRTESGRLGALVFDGTLFIDGGTLAFEADAKVTKGYCGFAGWTGTAIHHGNLLTGGQAFSLAPPKNLAPSDAGCVAALAAKVLTKEPPIPS